MARTNKSEDNDYSYKRKISAREKASFGGVEIQPRRLRSEPQKNMTYLREINREIKVAELKERLVRPNHAQQRRDLTRSFVKIKADMNGTILHDEQNQGNGTPTDQTHRRQPRVEELAAERTRDREHRGMNQ